MLNIQMINTGKYKLGQWESTNDHSKWCVSTNQNRPWTCIADVNRADTQFSRHGGALCINNKIITKMFKGLVGNTGDKSGQTKMDDNSADTDPKWCKTVSD